jgi:hypothetical protein
MTVELFVLSQIASTATILGNPRYQSSDLRLPVLGKVVKRVAAPPRGANGTDGVTYCDSPSVLVGKAKGSDATCEEDHPTPSLRDTKLRCIENCSCDGISHLL